MYWLQNLIVIISSYFLSRIIIDSDSHLYIINYFLSRFYYNISAMISGILILSYMLSLFFPNTVVVIALIPVIKTILETIETTQAERKYSTLFCLALIFGANIGGMGSMTGSSLNMFYISIAEFNQLNGRENITFFSWLALGVPGSLVLLLVSRLLLKIIENNKKLTDRQPLSDYGNSSRKHRKIVLLFSLNVIFLFGMTALQFLFKPSPVFYFVNIIDISMLAYLFMFLFTAFIRPLKIKSLTLYNYNFYFFAIFLFFSPLIFLCELGREVKNRMRFNLPYLRELNHFTERSVRNVWQVIFRRPVPSLKARNKNALISMNRLIYDLPFLGIAFTGLIFLFAFLLLKIGDNPATAEFDGYLVRYFEQLSFYSLNQLKHGFWLLLIPVYFSIFLTEMLNNTSAFLIMVPIILKLTAGINIAPAILLVLVTISASGAFMTPIATPVNAIAFTSFRGVSLKRMVGIGLMLNLLAGIWISSLFYFLSNLQH